MCHYRQLLETTSPMLRTATNSPPNFSETLGIDGKTLLLTHVYPSRHEYLTALYRHICVMNRKQLFQVWKSIGQGLRRGPRFASLDDAVRFAFSHQNNASYAIQMPSGNWHKFGRNSCILHRTGRTC